VELLAVVVILGLAMGVAVGVAGPMSSASSERAAIAGLTALLERARATALARGECSVLFDAATGAVALEQPGPGNGEPMAVAVIIAPNWTALAFESDQWTTTLSTLRFDHEGRCRDVFIQLNGPRDATARVELLGATGQLNLLDVEP
jgi:type II secretory pathway pseudopilin PulG